MGGGILDWEDEYGVIESYPNDAVIGASPVGGGVGKDVGFVSCDQKAWLGKRR